MPDHLDRLPPNYRKVEDFAQNPDSPSCFNCLFLRTHELRYTCHRYLAYILSSYVCDDWQKRPTVPGWETLELTKEDLKMIETHPIRDLQRSFMPKD